MSILNQKDNENNEITLDIWDGKYRYGRERRLAFTIFSGQTSPNPIQVYGYFWDQVCAQLRMRDIRDSKDGKAFSGVKLKDGMPRASANVERVDFLVADIDSKEGNPAPQFETLCNKHQLWDYEFFACSTHSNTDEAPKYRIVFPLSRSITPEEFKAIWPIFNQRLGGHCDPATKDVSRIFFLPSCSAESHGSSWMHHNAGEWIDPVDLMPVKYQNNLPANPPSSVVSQFNMSDDLSAGLTTTSRFEQNEANIKDFKSACDVAYPNGIVTRGDFIEVCFACAELQVVHGWDESVAKATLDEISSKPENAKRAKNDTEWVNALKGTKDKHTRGEVIAGHGAIMKRAVGLGWKPTAVQNPVMGDALAHLQAKYALISIGGSVGVFDKEKLSSYCDNGMAAQLEVFNKSNAQQIKLPRELAKTFAGVDSKNVIRDFFLLPSTEEFDGVDFNPKPHSGSKALNLWVPHTLEPKAGSWPVLEDFLREVICNGDAVSFDYLIKYLAHALQKPEDKPGVMIVLLGEQGVGKGTLSTILKRVWSATFLKISDVDQILGQFNASLERSYWVFMDEALFVGDRRSSDKLKSLVSEGEILINQKNQPARQVRSVHRFVSATNADHFKNTERDDRRDFVLKVSSKHKGDFAYWEKVNKAIDGDELSAMVNYLMGLDLREFNVRMKPNTGELANQKIASLKGFDKFWFDALCRGSLDGNMSEWPDFKPSMDLADSSNKYCEGDRGFKKLSDREVKALVTKICPSAKRERRGTQFSRKWGFALPDLKRARGDFEVYLDATIDWEEVGGVE